VACLPNPNPSGPRSTHASPHPSTRPGPPATTTCHPRARTHNLKPLAPSPHNALTVVTESPFGQVLARLRHGLRRGQRRYVESLSACAQFLSGSRSPTWPHGRPPRHRHLSRRTDAQPRSTVATATESTTYLRLLFARCGRSLPALRPHRPHDTVEDRCAPARAAGARALRLFPIVRAE